MTTTNISSFRATTEQGWDMAVDTAEIGHDDGTARKATAEADRESALEAWDRAETAIETGNIAAALEALEEARSLAASWGDDAPEREAAQAVRDDADPDMVILEEMPDQHRASHRAARNWGSYPDNGATRRQCSREEADEVVAADEDEYDHIVE